jgi:hypothetical protein
MLKQDIDKYLEDNDREEEYKEFKEGKRIFCCNDDDTVELVFIYEDNLYVYYPEENNIMKSSCECAKIGKSLEYFFKRSGSVDLNIAEKLDILREKLKNEQRFYDSPTHGEMYFFDLDNIYDEDKDETDLGILLHVLFEDNFEVEDNLKDMENDMIDHFKNLNLL